MADTSPKHRKRPYFNKYPPFLVYSGQNQWIFTLNYIAKAVSSYEFQLMYSVHAHVKFRVVNTSNRKPRFRIGTWTWTFLHQKFSLQQPNQFLPHGP